MSERKGLPPGDERRKYSEPWRYNRYGSTGNTNPSINNTNSESYNNNNNNTNNSVSSSSSSLSNNRRFSEQRPGSYPKSRATSTGSYNSGYGRYSSYDSKYQSSGYGYNKRYNYRSHSPSGTTANNQEYFHHSKLPIPSSSTSTSTSTAAVPTTNSHLPPFQRYSSRQDETTASTLQRNKRSGDLINNSSRVPSYLSNSYDSRDPYRSNRFYGYNREHNNGYDNRYRGYQRKTSNEHIQRDLEDDDLIYGSIKPKSEPLKGLLSDSHSATEDNEITQNDKKEANDEVKVGSEGHHELEVALLKNVEDEKDVGKHIEEEQESVKSQNNLQDQEDQVKEENQNQIQETEPENQDKRLDEYQRENGLMDIDEPPLTKDTSIDDQPVNERESSVSSDSYDPADLPIAEAVPAVKAEVTIETKNLPLESVELEQVKQAKPSLISSIRDDIDELDVDDELDKMDADSKINYLPDDVEGCIFPMNRLESKLWSLKSNSKLKVRSRLPYLTSRSMRDFEIYPFFQTNLLIHQQAIRPKLLQKFSFIKKSVKTREKKLLLEFHERDTNWKERVRLMEDQLKAIHQTSESEKEAPIDESSSVLKSATDDLIPPNSGSSRRLRHTGVVNSEAEFAEILQRMKEEEENDPLFRARQAAAVIPEMIINPIEKYAFKFLSTNNLVTDLRAWESRLETDKIDNFTSLEHELFCEAYASFPKRFGKISSIMQNRRSPEECVLHYYRTKRYTNYKQLVMAKNKRLGRKAGSAKGRTKSIAKPKTGTQTSNTSNVSTPASSTLEKSGEYFPVTDAETGGKSDYELAATDDQDEIVYTDTGRRKRAAAPSFDKIETGPDEVNSKRVVSNGSLETIDKKLSLELDQPKIKKQRGPKKKVKEVEEVKSEGAIQPVTDSESAQQLEHLKSVATAALPVSDDAITTEPEIKDQEQQHETVQDKVDSPPLNGQLKTMKKDKKPPHITSYWSINDANKFPSILAQYGTQWKLIAKEIQTKTTTMVRNYYSKNANNVNNWVAIAREADMKRNGPEKSEVHYEPLQVYSAQQQHEQQQQQQQEIYAPFHQPPQSMKLPSLRDLTQGMYNAPVVPPHFTSPPPFGPVFQQSKREDDDKKYANVLNPSDSDQFRLPTQQKLAPMPAPVPASRTSIMSLLNSEPSSNNTTTTRANPLDNILNPTTQQYPQAKNTPPESQPPQPPQLAAPSGLFSLAALAEVATEGLNSGNFKNEEKQ